MKIPYTVVHCPEPWLMARFVTDLELHGVKNNEKWNGEVNPFIEGDYNSEWIAINPYFYFVNHEGGGYPIRYTLTKENYLTVLTNILNSAE